MAKNPLFFCFISQKGTFFHDGSPSERKTKRDVICSIPALYDKFKIKL